jgi:hypothetical protein
MGYFSINDCLLIEGKYKLFFIDCHFKNEFNQIAKTSKPVLFMT